MGSEGKVDFSEDADFAVSDSIKKKNYQIVIKHFPVKKFDAVEQEEKLDYHDYICELNDGKKLKIEFKNRREGAYWNDIALEIYHDYKTKYGGCVFNLIKNEIDYYIYVWHGKQKECYIILKAKGLEEWWRENYLKYPQRINKETWKNGKFRNQSSWTPVPIKDIPKEIIYKHQTFIDLNDFWNTK